MRIIKQIITTALIFCQLSLLAQSPVGIGTLTPDSKAALHINTATKGVFIPRLSTAQQSTLAASLNVNHKGLLITDSTYGTTLYWNGAAWKDCDPLTITTTSPLSITATNMVALNAGTSVGDLITWDGNNWINQQPAVQHFNLIVNNMQPYLAINYCIALQGIFPSRNGTDPYLGQLGLFSFNYAPKGWAQCSGQLLSINQNQALFALLGTYYGGNGVNTFALPDLRGKAPIHVGTGSGLSNYTNGQTGGTEVNSIIK